METIWLQWACGYCPNIIEKVAVSDEDYEELDDLNMPPTHVEVKCPKCGNKTYYYMDDWGIRDAGPGGIKARKTSPGKNIYVTHEDIISVN
jgi:hypothetical protein